ncbi:VOC family protein [Evansella halocellulosilytica]|uniref:VOC family protein n=1 Tax=Evansella halocellulosilytica TaxID=2011013 RepID=UPI000BB95204|nr:VOC family protein [Evansella halocellulosilytica]
MTIKALDIPIIQLPVSDVAQSVKWYTNILGLEFTFEYQDGDQEAWMNVNGGIGLGLVQAKNVPDLTFENMKGERNSILTFRVDDIHSVYDQMKKKGEAVGEMVYKEGGGYSFIIKDPDGHMSYLWGGWPK